MTVGFWQFLHTLPFEPCAPLVCVSKNRLMGTVTVLQRGKEGTSELVGFVFLFFKRMLSYWYFVLKNASVDDLYSVTLFDHGPNGS